MKKLVDRAGTALRRILRRGDDPPPYDPARIRTEFDPSFYLSQFDPGSRPSDPFEHFLTRGWRDGHDPSALFSVNDYLSFNPDVAAADINPLAHYVTFGRQEGRSIAASHHRAQLVEAPDPVNAPAPDAGPDTGDDTAMMVEANELAEELNVAFYQAISGLTFPSAREAALHYMRTGWQLGLDPSPDFSTTAYLNHYPDILRSGQVPFLHYIRSGRAEGRIAVDRVDDVARILAATPDITALDAHWSHGRDPIPVLSRQEAAAQILEALPAKARRLIFALTHDDFTAVRGGIQLCVGQEVKHAADTGVAYIALHPVVPRPRLAPEGESPALFVTIGDTRIGPVPMDSLRDVARRYRDVMRVDVVIHALLGHAPEDVVSLADAAGAEMLFAWLHDSFFLCGSFALQRNLVSYCGAPAPGSAACRMCLFGADRSDHLRRLASMLDHLPTHAIAPSQAAADIVLERGDLRFDGVSIVPHAQLSDGAPRGATRAGPARIAFLGTPSRHKGYHVFRDVARRNLGRDDVQFLYFGASSHREPGIPTVPVDVTPDTPDAMVEALAKEGVDFVVQWSQFIETFSFVTVEAMRAGAEILTHPGSGNVAALTAQTGRGHVLEDQAALEAFLKPEHLAQVTRRLRAVPHPQLCVASSTLSFEVLDRAAAGQAEMRDAPLPPVRSVKGLR